MVELDFLDYSGDWKCVGLRVFPSVSERVRMRPTRLDVVREWFGSRYVLTPLSDAPLRRGFQGGLSFTLSLHYFWVSVAPYGVVGQTAFRHTRRPWFSFLGDGAIGYCCLPRGYQSIGYALFTLIRDPSRRLLSC